ncbi:MAG: PIN domain-containing protein [Candidatus Nanohalobium sp.]
MKFLDTSFLVDYLKGRDYTLEYLEENSEEAFYASSLTIFELYRGELNSEGKSDLEDLKERLEWLETAQLDNETAEEAAKIEKALSNQGEKVNLADTLIAGEASKKGVKIVTRDRDFQKMSKIEVETPEDR